jgi:hypothetical protein
MRNNPIGSIISDKTRGFLLPLLIFLNPASANSSTAYQNYIYGDVKDITSVRGALMVRIDDDKVPTVCSSAGSSWMRIEQTETAMTSVILSYWLQGKKRFTFYSDGLSSGYCSINQADPEA